MKKLLVPLFFCSAVFAQDANIHDVKYRYERAVQRIQGVQDFSVAGVDGQLKLHIRVDSLEARDAVRLLCGESLAGHPLQITVAGTTTPPPIDPPTAPPPRTDCSTCTCPCHQKVGQTVAEQRPPEKRFDQERVDDPTYESEQCDMIRKLLGLPLRPAPSEVRCEQMVGWTNDPSKIRWILSNSLPHWQSREMPGIRGSDPKGTEGLTCKDHGKHLGETIAYTYVRHRQFCPRGMKQLLDDLSEMTPGK